MTYIDQTATDKATDERIYFDSFAEKYEVFIKDLDHMYRPWLASVLPASGGRAVDLGCGTGIFEDMLAARFQEVLAVDLSEQQVQLAQQLRPFPNVEYNVRSLLDVTPERDGVFDLVISLNTLHCLRDYDRALSHLRKLVAPGGQLLTVEIVKTGDDKSLAWNIDEAFRDARDSYENRSKDADVAGKVLALRLDAGWLEHVMTNIKLPREELARHYQQAFPGVRVDHTFSNFASAFQWQAPADNP